MIKISFSGMPGSGKTSLLTEVKKILSLKSKVDSIEEINRKNPFDESKKSSFVSQFFYISTQINEENIKCQKPLDFLLCDRSVLDQWVYWKNHLNKKEINNHLEEKSNLIFQLYQLWIKTYDVIFLIKVNVKELEKREFRNEFRRTDVEYLKKMEKMFDQVIKEDQLDVVVALHIGNNRPEEPDVLQSS